MKKLVVLFWLLIALASTSIATAQQPELNPLSKTLQTGVPIPAKGKAIHPDSVQVPIVIRLKGQPKSVPTNTNVHEVGVPKVVKAKVYTPNLDSITAVILTSMGDTLQTGSPIPTEGKVVTAKLPQVVKTKDAYISNKNPAGFSVFGKLQGLKHGFVDAMLQDRKGNIWYATVGGLSKYDGKFFTHYTQAEGLSNNSVLSIIEDKKGNLWFGTYDGVTKYDGKTFTHFTQTEGLSNNRVRSIIEDKEGNLWFGTDGGGATKYDGKTFTHFTQTQGLSNNSVLSMIEDKKGNLWFGTFDGVTKYDGNTFTHFTQAEGLSNNMVRSILEDKEGNLWFGTSGGGVSKYDGKTFTHFTESEGLSNNRVLSILEDKEGNLWFGTSGGVSKYDGKTFIHFTQTEGLSNNRVRSILEDKDGNLWFGTSGGVSKYDGKTFAHFTQSEGLSNNIVWSNLEDREGNLWFGTSGGVSKYDGKTFTHYTQSEGLINNIIWSSLEDKDGNLWFGTSGGVSKYDGKTFTNFTQSEGLSNNVVRSILEDKEGNLWFGTDGGGVSKYDGNTFTHFTQTEGLSNNRVWSSVMDKEGNLWFTTDGGVSKYDGKTITNFTQTEGLSNNIVWSSLADKEGNLWFGTTNGVSKYDRKRAITNPCNLNSCSHNVRAQHDLIEHRKELAKSFTHFTESEGLSNNFVFSMLEDNMGNIWFGTRFGISIIEERSMDMLAANTDKVKFSTPLFKKCGYNDGVYGIGINGGKTMIQANDGMIWVGTNDRLMRVNPTSNLFKEHEPPQIELNAIELFNEQVVWLNLKDKQDSIVTLQNGITVADFQFDGVTKWSNLPKNLSLAYNNNSLTFKFIGITMYQPKNVKYRYKLEGIDKNWSSITGKPEAPYGNLPHGDYTFKVKAMNSNGDWSQEYCYSFTIRPPLWQTWWAFLIYFSIAVLSLWLFVNQKTKRLKEKHEELEYEVEVATTEIREQKEHIEEVHKEITDSIEYAERIQYSFMATKEMLDKNLGEYFVFFKPKDVVSGDFYWADILSNGDFALVNADSTGHGVPGAIMSILNISSIEKAVEKGVCDPAEIFNETRKSIIERLKKDGSEHGGKEGMDASIVCFNPDKSKMTYTAAQNPIWVIRAGEVTQIKAEKMPVGKHDNDHIPFEGGEFKLQKGDQVYTLTDGFQDQFGGPEGKKFMIKKMREYVVSISHLPMQEQHQKLEEVFSNWKGDIEQVDDVCVIGVKV